MGQRWLDLQKLISIETDECVEWPFAGTPEGYGQLSREGRRVYAHREALIARVGPPPEGLPLALHRPVVCHNPSCVNYRHLYWGDSVNNARDREPDGTQARPGPGGRACEVEECGRPHYAFGRCNTHYMQQRRSARRRDMMGS